MATMIGEKDAQKNDDKARIAEEADEEKESPKKDIPGEDSKNQRFVSYEQVKKIEDQPAKEDEKGRVHSF